MAETHAIKGGQHRGREVKFGWAEETGLQAQVHEGWVAFGLAAEALAVDCGLDVVGLAERLQRADAEVSAAAATMGRKGGRVRSEAKTAAVRQNAQRGGRPRLVWSDDHEYNQVRIFETASGWRVDVWRQEMGAPTDESYIVPFSDDLPKGCDLSKPRNGIMSQGEFLSLPDIYREGRCRRRGHVVR